nr:hypothetical protein PJ912_01340 [Pectobacterium colocasium]
MGDGKMMRRYSFEIMFSLVLLCGLITLSFSLVHNASALRSDESESPDKRTLKPIMRDMRFDRRTALKTNQNISNS